VVFYNSLVKYVTHPLIRRRKGLYGIDRFLKEFERQQYFSADKLKDMQFAKLKKLIRHAYATTEYYSRKFDEWGIDPSDIRSPEDVQKLPILTKKDILENISGLISKEYESDDLIASATGGTTGVKINFFYAKDSLAIKQAATYRAERWTGWDIGGTRGLIWPAQQDYVGYGSRKEKIRNALSERQVVLPAAILDEEKIAKYIDALKSKKPKMIRGFPNAMSIVADYILQKNIKLNFESNVISTGEPLQAHQRKSFEKVFHGQVFNSYSAREVALIGQECERHDGLHINMECNFVEFVDKDNGTWVKSGEIGDIIITDLLNYGMPFIRYQIGDVGIPDSKLCPCGRGLELFGGVEGRDADIFKLRGGKKVSAITLVLYLVDNGPMVGKVQIIQDAIDHLRIKITDDPMPDKEIFEYYEKTVAGLLGDEMKISFEVVKDIPTEKSGKYRFTKCEI
jgi:phenylacetate-CoA ligase